MTFISSTQQNCQARFDSSLSVPQNENFLLAESQVNLEGLHFLISLLLGIMVPCPSMKSLLLVVRPAILSPLTPSRMVTDFPNTCMALYSFFKAVFLNLPIYSPVSKCFGFFDFSYWAKAFTNICVSILNWRYISFSPGHFHRIFVLYNRWMVNFTRNYTAVLQYGELYHFAFPLTMYKQSSFQQIWHFHLFNFSHSK